MNEKNTAANRVEEPSLRITRARAKSLGTSGTLIQKPPLSKQSQALKENSKRLASDENKSTLPFPSLMKKRKTTLTDVTNVLCDKSYAHCCTGGKFQKTKLEKKGLIRKNGKVPPSIHGTIRHQDDPKDKIAEDISKLTVAPLKIAPSAKQNSTNISNFDGEYHKWTKLEDNKRINVISSEIKERLVTAQLLQKETKHHEKIGDLKHPIVIDIDRNQKDPLMCNIYVSDIYEYKRVIELNQRLSVDYMEMVQRDITPSMRGILIDWLVEVSEEYKLVPDTLYLTVNLIDRYLSGNFIEKQKLQLLGVACMFIASKYEEMNAPQVEDFCYITANTYARKDVLKMERKVLNFLYFQLSVPTIKTFLRRYIHVAQATYKDPLVNLEFLADYLAELTLVEYSFFRFLPSLIAASAVFLARWTLDQSDYPWNPTLEFYTSYKVTDLKVTVIAMQDLQLNTINSPLNAIREKYRHDKFNCVANLSSPDPVESLF
ncbi:cyclin-A2-2-like [Amaranthus tricolor]|uniref:cyclin-A2-2-like n=1 Tax=Amaranthus tricolor TaxID=29722 RepID=UPI00258743B6|nr:cyclin-A2-2-like [Amaranthus tricolor]XP_057524065.1 cyclin-A2-2-like [Amaranthus tricolor]